MEILLPKPKKPRPKGHRKVYYTKSHTPGEDQIIRKHGYVKSFDGTKLFYSVEGEGKPLVFCYGLVCSSLHWTYQIDYFRKNYQTIWFDYRGHQNSEAPKDFSSLTVNNISQDLKIILDDIGIKEAVFLGHSMGVNVVLDFYRNYPEYVHSMVLANGTPKKPLETLFTNNLTSDAFGLLFKLYKKIPNLVNKVWKLQKKNPFSHSFIAYSGFNPHLTSREDIMQYVDEMAEMDPGILFYLIQNYNDYDAIPWLHEITKKTLIIAGENDHITPLEQQQLMHQLIPNSEFIKIAKGSHCPQMDLPDLVNLHIEKFLKKIHY